MTTFTASTAAVRVAPPDPHKHVYYNLGMVLGVDDFNQEFAYLLGRDQWMARDTIGYGTVCGLRIFVDTDNSNGKARPRVSVTPGTAISPRGQLIRVTPQQCAYLNDWLIANKDHVTSALNSPPSNTLDLYVVLCYRECPTDNVIVPGEPCRSENELQVSSRLNDDYQLELRFKAPNQREEDALRLFVERLSQVTVTEEIGIFTSPKDFSDAVRHALDDTLSSPLGSPLDSPIGSPLAGPFDGMRIHSSDVCEYLHTAFRIWTTELRPKWKDQGCAGDVPTEECVMLAELHIPIKQALNGDWVVTDINTVEIHEEHRPYLVHLRLLQEWLLCGWHGDTKTATPSDTVVAETSYGQAPQPGTLESYSRADHTHGTPPEPTLAGDVTGPVSKTKISALQGKTVKAQNPKEDDVLTFKGNQWIATPPSTPAPPTLAGDVTGPVSKTTISALQEKTVKAQNPTDRDILMFNKAGNEWITTQLPAPIEPTLAGDVTGHVGTTTISALQGKTVSAQNPTDGDMLVFKGNQWITASTPNITGAFVEHPNDQPGYGIVAAGIVQGNGNVRNPVYNDLHAKAIGNGLFLVTFKGYKPPEGFQYIVKALPVFNNRIRPVCVFFDQYQAEGIVLHVVDLSNGNATNIEILNLLELMIEVSQFPFKQ